MAQAHCSSVLFPLPMIGRMLLMCLQSRCGDSFAKQLTLLLLELNIVSIWGSNISFWTDHWLSGGPLSVRFPHLFRLSDLSDIFVAEAWRDTIEVWDLHFRRNFIGSEILEWASLTVILALVRFPMVPGSWKWTIDSSTSFTVNLH